MRQKRVIIACLLLSLATLGAEAMRTSPNSFSKYRAPSAPKLAAAVKKNPKLANTYAKHFGTSPSKVVSLFGDLKLTRLKKAKRVSFFSLHSNGKITYRMKTLPAGKKVFVTETGVPILDWNCGNPLTKVLEPVRAAAQPKTFVEKIVEKAAETPPDVKVAAASVQELVPAVAELPVAGLTSEVFSDPILPLTTEMVASPTIVASMPSSDFFLPPGGFFLSLIPLFAGHGGSDGVVDRDVYKTPETSSLAALGMGVTMLGALLRQRRRSARLA